MDRLASLVSFDRFMAKAVNAAETARFMRAAKDPEGAGAALWTKNHALLSQAPFWKERLLPRLEDHDVTQYADYAAAIEQDESSALSQLSGQRIVLWAESAGTTKTPKRFPLTDRYRQQFQRLNPPFLSGLLKRHTGFARAPVLYFAGMHPTVRTSAGVDVGYISNFNYRRVPKPLRRMYAVPAEVLQSEEIYTSHAPVYALCRDLSAMFAIAPNRIVAFAQSMVQQVDEIVARLEGRLPVASGLPPLHISSQRLALVREALRDASRTGAVDFTRLWPGLALIGCWKTAVCRLQLPALQRVSGPVPIVDAIYSATEGWFTVPSGDPDEVGGPVHVGAILTEYFPVGEKPSKVLLKPHELEVGKDYEIVVTNFMGLVRYRLFDIVRCTGFFHRSPILQFVGKVGAELLVGLSRFSEEQLVNAMADQSLPPPWIFGVSSLGTQVVLYHPEHVVVDQSITAAVERELRAVNDYYAAEVDSGAIQPVGSQALPARHPVFTRAEHAQTKPRCFVNEALS